MAWRFYVYELLNDSGACRYVGKGSGNRVKTQARNFGLAGYEVARFKREDDAYAYERTRIAERAPDINKCAGGNGNRVTTRAPRDPKWVRDINKVGTRVYAARILCAIYKAAPQYMPPPSKVEAIRRVAYG